MAVVQKPVPVRVTVWHEGIRLDFRYWLDELTVDNNIVAGRYPRWSASMLGGDRDLTVKAHTSPDHPAWKFHRGKPVQP